jgi:tripartite-type tricarboxylate transporter receptor subunit TctC
MMIVNPSVPVMMVADFIAYVKTNPGKINMASGGIGTTSHVAGELFKVMTGLDMTHVPYPGGAAPATTDLLGGHVQVMFSGGLSSIPYIRTGSLRAPAVTTATRWDALPDIPTVGESVVLVDSMRRIGLRHTQFADAAVATIRLKLLKLGA